MKCFLNHKNVFLPKWLVSDGGRPVILLSSSEHQAKVDFATYNKYLALDGDRKKQICLPETNVDGITAKLYKGNEMTPLTKTEKAVLKAINKLGGKCEIMDIVKLTKLGYRAVSNALSKCKLFVLVGREYKVNSNYAYNESVGYFVEVC